MNRWSSLWCRSALALALVVTLADCGGGGGGGGGAGQRIRVYFGMNGDGACNSVVVRVDLADADAVLARTNDQAPECELDRALVVSGCQATFQELANGEQLVVAITGCSIPAVTNLFSCVFTEVDLSDLGSESSAQCSCTVSGCNGRPPLCVDEDRDPRSCEDCDNGLDDDGNGLADCDDPNCAHAPECNPVSTTTVTLPPPSSTTTLEPTTTTTLPDEPIEVNFLLTDALEPLGSLEFTANYTSAPGRFVGDGPDVACFSPLGNVLFTASASDATSKLTLGFASVSGIASPTPLATCLFQPNVPVPVPANFTIVVNESSDTDGERVRGVRVDVTVTGVPED